MNEKGLDQAHRRGASENYIGAERNQNHAGGKMIARSGSNRWHNLIVSNTAIAAGSKMHGHKCEIYISNMRVRMTNNFICYPDIVFVKDEPKFADSNLDMLLNPTVVVEIFSSSTNTFDKTIKFSRNGEYSRMHPA